MTFQPADPETAQAIREHIARMRGEQPSNECPRCNPTARAIAFVQALWVVAGMDKGE